MTCHCLCFASHIERGICNMDAPRALVDVSLDGSALDTFELGAHCATTMCQPCAEAAVGQHPRMHGFVLEDESWQL